MVNMKINNHKPVLYATQLVKHVQVLANQNVTHVKLEHSLLVELVLLNVHLVHMDKLKIMFVTLATLNVKVAQENQTKNV